MEYTFWLTVITDITKDRYGEMSMYMMQQLLARYNMERISHKMVTWDKPVTDGCWHKIKLHNGEEMLTRNSNTRHGGQQTHQNGKFVIGNFIIRRTKRSVIRIASSFLIFHVLVAL